MKIAIKGHESRGKEVIQILESLGGINDGSHEGNNSDCYYELHSNIIWCVNTKGINFKYYTLEEFEKEFPFKIGDKVVCKENLYALHTIIGISYNSSSCLQYEIKEDKTGIIVHYPTDLLIKYNEMDVRRVTITLDKAKEWYKKGGALKEIALQAFSKEELNPLPRSWEEFCEKYSKIDDKEYFIDFNSSILQVKAVVSNPCRLQNSDKNICPSQKSAEAHLAMIQLEQLRNCWWGDWRPEWSNNEKYVIKWEENNLIAFTARRVHAFLVFPTIEMAGEFLECFRDLIEKAGDLI